MTAPLRFGVFPLGIAGGPDGLATGAPDDFARIAEAVTQLQGDKPPLIPRMYVAWSSAGASRARAQVAELAGPGLPWDLVLCFQDPAGDVAAYAEFVAGVVREYGGTLDSVQVTGEPNLTGLPFAADGEFPNVVPAMIAGVRAGACAKKEAGHPVGIGIAVVPETFGRTGFWAEVAAAGPPFASALDYAGLDIYPDVFGGRVPFASLPSVVESMVRAYRHDLTSAGVAATTPIRICENGWPTGPDRPEEKQADVLECVIRTLHELRAELNITRWQLFTLRDADSDGPSPFHHFGILNDDYSPKPAFHRLRALIAELA